MIFERIATRENLSLGQCHLAHPSHVVYFQGWCVKLKDLTWWKKEIPATVVQYELIICDLSISETQGQ